MYSVRLSEAPCELAEGLPPHCAETSKDSPSRWRFRPPSGGEAGTLFRLTWAFVLEPIDDSHTRLLARVRGESKRLAGKLRILVFHPVHFAMERKQLRNIKRRVEATA